MNDIQIFENPTFGKIRTVEIDEEPWFLGNDIALVLGYTNPRKALADHVDSEDKNTVTIRDGIPGNPNKTIINESGLYSLILSSKLPDAKKFKRWVTNEVLPAVRKHGAYMTPETIEQTLSDPDFIIRLATELKEEQAKRKILEADNERMKPKEIFTDAVTESSNSILIGELAKLLRQNGVDIGQNRLFQWMRNKGYLCNAKGERHNMPTQKSMDMGLLEIKKTVIQNPNGSTQVVRTPKVTGKGQVYFINKFLAKSEAVST